MDTEKIKVTATKEMLCGTFRAGKCFGEGIILQKGGAGMKKWKDIMKSKGIYIVSLFGTITILAVAAIAMNLMEGSTKDGAE